MRLLIAGDVHGNTAHMLDLLRIADDHDCEHMVQLGDFGGWEHTDDGRTFLEDVSRDAARREIPIVWLGGNHDDEAAVMKLHGDDRTFDGFVIQRDYAVYHAPRGHRWEWDGVRFMALGGAYSVDKGWRVDQEYFMTLASKRQAARTGRTPQDFTGWLWFPGEELTDDDVTTAIGDGAGVDVMLTHDKPRRSVPDWNRKDLPKCWPNQDRAQAVADALRPSHWYHGHLHYRYDDVIQLGDDRSTPCQVHGLGADPWSAEHAAYDPRDSWVVVDTAGLGS